MQRLSIILVLCFEIDASNQGIICACMILQTLCLILRFVYL